MKWDGRFNPFAVPDGRILWSNGVAEYFRMREFRKSSRSFEDWYLRLSPTA